MSNTVTIHRDTPELSEDSVMKKVARKLHPYAGAKVRKSTKSECHERLEYIADKLVDHRHK